MAVFVAAADESIAGDGGGEFYFGGFVAPERDWNEFFAPAWQERVLDTDPKLSHFHMTEIKSARWRLENGVSDLQAERKVGEACRVIRSQGSLYPITQHLDGGHFRAAMEQAEIWMNIKTPGGIAKRRFEPDYMCFVRFALSVLLYVHESHSDATRVDFVIERNGRITRYMQRFHEGIPNALRNKLGRPDLADLVGELLPAGKDRVPLQAADLFCWYARNVRNLGVADSRRFYHLAKRAGHRGYATNEEIDDFATRAVAADLTTDDRDFEGVRGPS